jgi:hypothetical protein
MQFDGGLAGGKHDGLPSLIDPGAGGWAATKSASAAAKLRSAGRISELN